MPSGKTTSVEEWVKYLEIRKEGKSIYAAAKETAVSYHVALKSESGDQPKNYINALELTGKDLTVGIPNYKDLKPEAKAAYDNIEIFARRYFGIVLQPWQIEATERIMALMETEYEEYAVINAPPGCGKSTFFAKVLPAWATVRNRAIRGMIGSSSQRLAEWYSRRLRSELDRAYPVRAELNDVRLGLAVTQKPRSKKTSVCLDQTQQRSGDLKPSLYYNKVTFRYLKKNPHGLRSGWTPVSLEADSIS